MNKIRAILFDVDGTLLDTKEFILRATEHTLSTFGFKVPDRFAISKLVGIPFDEFYRTLTGLTDSLVLQKAHQEFQLANLHLSTGFPNTKETLAALKKRGFKLAIITSRSKNTALETLRGANIHEMFDIMIFKDDAQELKPHPAPLLKAMEGLAVDPAEAVMIGDSHLDVQAGKNAGTQTVRAIYGFHTDNLHDPRPDYIIGGIGELLNIF